MKWFSFRAAILAVALGSTTANAELFNRASRLFDLQAPIETLFEGPAIVTESTEAMAAPAIPQEVVHYGNYGNAGVRYGHGKGCCQEDIGFARSLWSCYCGQRHKRHISCELGSKCQPAHCGVKAKRCKPQFCKPKLNFHWARLHCGKSHCGLSHCGKPACNLGCGLEPVCGHKHRGHKHRVHKHHCKPFGHGCNVCEQPKCGGCSKHVRCHKPHWDFKLFSWKSGHCSAGCSDRGMSNYKVKGGEIWSDAEEIKSSLTPPTPEPATNEVSAPSTDKSARLWTIPIALPSWPQIFGR